MNNKPKPSVRFEITEAQKIKVDALPRSVNLSEKLRIALDDILDGLEEDTQ